MFNDELKPQKTKTREEINQHGWCRAMENGTNAKIEVEN